MSKSNESHTAEYVFEPTGEVKRLQEQAPRIDVSTRQAFEMAGIQSGMKVLDVGSGTGDVALLLAKMVGPRGTIVGVDFNAEHLATARQRVYAAELLNVSFVCEDIGGAALDEDFDAVVGRLILMHIPDKAALFTKLVSHLRPGGILAFVEPDFTYPIIASAPALLFEQATNWVRETFRRAGIETQMGLRWYDLFLEAGLSEPEMGLMVSIGGGPNWFMYEELADLVRGLLPLIVNFEVATVEEVEIDTLVQRLRAEAANQRGTVMTGWGLSYASARKA